MKKRIVFVGDDRVLYQEFQARCLGPETDWDVLHVASEEAALELCQQSAIAAVVADVNVGGKSGNDLLNAVTRRQPDALRVVVSDLADVESTMKCIGQAHHHVLKPCSAQTLLHVLEQAFDQEAWLPSKPVQGLLAQMRQVPSPIKAYTQIVEEMKSPDCSIEKIAGLAAQDPAIAAKILQLANSAIFGLELNVVRLVEAISYIGFETTKAVILLGHTFSSFDHLKLVQYSIDDLWRHSVRVGQSSRRIAELEGVPEETAEQAFAAGLLHDIGKLLFAANHPGVFAKVLRLARDSHCNVWEAEAQLMPGVGHAELGATILGIWGLPKPVTEAVALHHCPWRERGRAFSPLTAVHAANIFEHEARPDPSIILPSQINLSYLEERNLAGRVEAWRRECVNLKGNMN